MINTTPPLSISSVSPPLDPNANSLTFSKEKSDELAFRQSLKTIPDDSSMEETIQKTQKFVPPAEKDPSTGIKRTYSQIAPDNLDLKLENLPFLIKGKTHAEIVEILNQANQLFPDNWMDKLDLPTKATFFIAQHETKGMDLKNLCTNLNQIMEGLGYSLTIEGPLLTLEITEDQPHHNYEMLKALSSISTLALVHLNTKSLVDPINSISFPYVKKVELGPQFNQPYIDLKKLFPIANNYLLSIKKTRELFNQIPDDTISLSCVESPKCSLNQETLLFIKEKFKQLQTLNWLNIETGKALAFPYFNFTRTDNIVWLKDD